MTHTQARHRSMHWLGAGIAAAAVLLTSVVTTAGDAGGAELSDVGASAFAEVAACAAASDHLLAAVVVDSSGSLRQTDPGDQRVGAIETALDALEQLGASSDGLLDVQTSLATFGRGYDELVGWGPLMGGHAEALRTATAREIPTKDRDDLTDYRAALRGAQQSLDSHAAGLPGSSCKLLLWFTDGRLDVDGTGTGATTDAARAELCAPQGLLDGLRGDGVTVVALALFTAGDGGSVTDQDRDRLKAVAEGAGAGETCGTTPIPVSSTGGAYLRADDAGAMRRLFAQAAALISGRTPGLSVACPDDVCVGGELRIPTDRGLGGFRLVLERGIGTVPPRLVAADGSAVDLAPGDGELGGATSTVTDRDGLMVADVLFPGAGATGGAWTLVTDPATTTFVDLYFYWGVTLDVEAPDGLVAGETGTVRIVPRHADGSAADTDELGSVDLAVTVDGAAREPVAVDGGAWQVEVAIPASDVPPSVHVEATARATTRDSGIALGPVSGRADLATALPPSFPTITPTRLDLPTIVDDGEATGTLMVAGSERGATRACFGAATVQAPAAAGEVTIVPASRCVDVPASGAVEVDFLAAAAHPASGRVDGVLPVTLHAVDGTDSLVLNVPVGLSMSRPVDEATRWGLVALFTTLAVLLAWGTAEVARRLGDRYRLGADTRSASVPVLVTRAGVRRAEAHAPELLSPAFDFEPVVTGRARRSAAFRVRGLEFRRSFGWFPLSAGRAWVRRVDDGIVVAPHRDALVLRPDASRAPAQFPGPVGFALAADGVEPDQGTGEPTVRGRLIVLVDSEDGVAAVLPQRLEEIAGAPWDRIVDAVVAATDARAQASTPGKDTSTPGAARTPTPEPGHDPVLEKSRRTPSTPDWSDEPLGAPSRSVGGSAPGTGPDAGWSLGHEVSPGPAVPTDGAGVRSRGPWRARRRPKRAEIEPHHGADRAEAYTTTPPDDPAQRSIVNFWD